MTDLHYPVTGSGQSLILELAVVKHLHSYRQLKVRDLEAGGQLFGKFAKKGVVISKSTGPRITDTRSRFRYIPNRSTERQEISEMFASDLHFVGDWHTHPQTIPTPSRVDIRSMEDLFNKSKHQLTGMVLIIVGQSDPPDGLYVAICNGEGCQQLRCAKQ